MDENDLKLPSNRVFGLFFAGVFAAFGAYQWILDHAIVATLCILASGCFGLATLVAQDALTPLNRLWMRFGLLLSKIVSPIVLGILFFGLFTPVAVVTRLLGRDELRLKMVNRSTHWKERNSQQLPPESFQNQF